MLGNHPSQWRTKISFQGKCRFSGWWHVAGQLHLFSQCFVSSEREYFMESISLSWLSDVVLCYTDSGRAVNQQFSMGWICYSKSINLTLFELRSEDIWIRFNGILNNMLQTWTLLASVFFLAYRTTRKKLFLLLVAVCGCVWDQPEGLDDSKAWNYLPHCPNWKKYKVYFYNLYVHREVMMYLAKG